MALPILETPSYELILPSTNKKVKYRPFLVKEYKILLTTVEADTSEITRIVTELVDNCTFNKLDIAKLAHFDVEYLFLNIRAKSISETSEIVINCECGNKIDYTLDITNLKVNKETAYDKKIMLTDDIGVVLRYPQFDEMLEIHDNANSTNVVELITNCIDAVFTKDEYFDKQSYTKEELSSFVSSFTKKQFDKLEEFFRNIPKIVQHIETDCPKCGKHNVVELEGLQNFFV
jgi:hypothetical protein